MAKELTIYHNPRCRKSRETLQIIEDAKVEPKIVEYLKTPLTKAELKNLLKQLDISAEALIRKGEPAFKENYKGKSLSEDDWIEAMIAHPKLIERPIVTNGQKAVLGRPPENVNELI